MTALPAKDPIAGSDPEDGGRQINNRTDMRGARYGITEILGNRAAT